MGKQSKFLRALLLIGILFLLKSNVVRAQLNSAGEYVWQATDQPKVFNNKLQLSFVNAPTGFPTYGTVLAGGGYYTSQDGGVFQMYFPYSPQIGGVAPQIRFGMYDNSGWSSWSTFFTTANANLSTVDWKTKNLTVYGNLLIGKTSQTNTSYKLDVDGIIRSQKVVVNTTGADYVFDSTYRLLEFDSLNAFIQKFHHLPGVQPADQMQKQGLDVAENQMVLLKKIEELTLYIIKINREVELKNKKLNN
jgi:hypothetical protein